MRTSRALVLLAVAAAMRVPAARSADPTPQIAHFNQAVLPILQRCVVCHSGPKPKGSLRLTTRALALQGGESGAALVPGKVDDSLIFSMVSSKEMPPNRPLAAAEVAAIRKWIEAGAAWEGVVAPVKATGTQQRAGGADWWSLQKLGRPRPPRLANSRWGRNPIDAFVLDRLTGRKLTPSPEADRTTLIRRVTFDLIGLPPTPEEIDAFLSDRSATAYERLVDRLLASPQHGERWARHWLDVARFGESQGFERDKIRDNAWPYRDYVVNSFNADKPYGLFVKEQIAGDVLAPVTPEGIVATGFLVAGPWDEVGQTQQGALMRMRVREEELEDIISVVSQTFLGLTINCARCHDHKFDPIPQRDYYRLKAVFEGIHPGDRPAIRPEQKTHRDQIVARANERIVELRKQVAAIVHLEKPNQRRRREDLLAALRHEEATLRDLPAMPMTYAANGGKAEPTFVLARGDVEKRKERVGPGALSTLAALSSDFGLDPDAPEGSRRLKLAEWLASSANPLPARVMVNRLWHYHFGQGLVPTTSDLGFNGGRPSHPELLDWLAGQLIDSGGSLKKLHRTIVLSSTYRQSSRFSAEAAALDAGNRLLWRFAPRRLEGEAIRDAMLAVSGQLNSRIGGPSFRPFIVKVFNSSFYELTDPIGTDFNRRTLYRINVNSAKSPLLDAFDCPDPSVKTPTRAVTTTPLQALGLMNNSFVLRQARALAGRIRREAGPECAREVVRAYRLTLGRAPTDRERARAVALATEYGAENVCWVLLNASELLYIR